YALFAQPLAHFVTAQLRQHEVENDQIGIVLPRRTVALLPVGGGQHLVRLEAQAVGEAAQNRRLVFDYQHSLHTGSSSGSRIVKALPRPGALSSSTAPPCASAM